MREDITSRPIGVCTWTFGDLPLAEIAGRVAALGLDGVELLGDLSRYSAGEAAQIMSDHGLQIVSLTPANVDISHPDPAVHRPAVNYFKRLLDFAAELGRPLVSCHGLVGRVAPVSTQAEENVLLRDAVTEIAHVAAERSLRVVFEVLNRYETHQICTGRAADELLDDVGADNLGILLDAYHMNIEEPDPAGAIRAVGERLWLYHAADSNRQGIGRGHTNFAAQFAALDDIGYAGPVILECTAPGPNPFTPIKEGDWLAALEDNLAASMKYLRN